MDSTNQNMLEGPSRQRLRGLLPGAAWSMEGDEAKGGVSMKKNIDKIIEELTLKAQAQAHNAWAKIDKDGVMGNMPLTNDVLERKKVGAYWRAGYAMALLDHTMNSVIEMRKAQDSDQQQAEKDLGKVVH